MKTAISLPDPLFLAADTLARRRGRSRSQLYADALREYLARHDEDQVTAQFNALSVDLDTHLEPDLAAASQQILDGTEW